MSELTSAMIVNGLVLIAVLEADLGSHRKISRFRIVRPLLMAGAIVPLYLEHFATRGNGLTLEIVAAVAGLLAGLAATGLTHVYRSTTTGGPVSRTGTAYAALWIAVIGARAAFSWGSVHWFAPQLTDWAVRNGVTGDAITDSLIVMAVAMLLTRTLGLAGRAAAPLTPARPTVRAAAGRI
jgi:hypothetical protein